MKTRWILSICVLLTMFFCAIEAVSQMAPPESVVAAFRKMDASGERLTVSGWCKAEEYFVQTEKYSVDGKMLVIRNEDVSSGTVSGSSAVVWTKFDALGVLERDGKFTNIFYARPVPLVGPFLSGSRYELVLTKTYWIYSEITSRPEVKSGPARWRIKEFQYEPKITVDTALRYLRKLLKDRKNPKDKMQIQRSIRKISQISNSYRCGTASAC